MATISGTVKVPFQVRHVTIGGTPYPVYELNSGNEPLWMYPDSDPQNPVSHLTSGNIYNLILVLDPTPPPTGEQFIVSVGGFHFIGASRPNVSPSQIVRNCTPGWNQASGTIDLDSNGINTRIQFEMEYSISVGNTAGQLVAVLDPPMPVDPAG